MALKVPVLDSIGPGTRLALSVGDDLELGSGIALITTASNPAVDAQGGNELTVFGRISSAGVGIQAAVGAAAPTILDVEIGGLVSGLVAVKAGSGLTLTNHGNVLGEATGVELNADVTTNQRLINHGRLVGGEDAIGLATILNTARVAAAVAPPAVSRVVAIENYGTIRGGSAALDLNDLSGTLDFEIYNEGRIRGGIFLGAGDDILRNRGSLVGTVDLGAGNDAFSAGLGAETIQGGAGTDAVIYTGLGFVNLTLDSTEGGTGSAMGDVMRGFENIHGSSTGFDSLTGNSVANLLAGNGGDDTLVGLAGNDTLTGETGNDSLDGGSGNDQLIGGVGNDTYIIDSATDVVTEALNAGSDLVKTSVNYSLGVHIENATVISVTGRALAGNSAVNRLTGGQGADTLNGGGGVDTLTGGAGADTFRFTAKAEAGDQITDFTTGVDKIAIDISVFGVVLPNGVLAPSRLAIRGDNIAQDADDRFIFRTTDKTLWIDINGNAAGGLTLIADMQATAAISSNDFAIF